MPVLKCSAETCVYNKEKLCSRGDIQIQGDHASSSDGTCCASFVERTGEINSMDRGCGCDTIEVHCTADDCSYNENCSCKAGAVDISGSSACSCEQTCCGTFQCK